MIVKAATLYEVECWAGNVRVWRECVPNLVVTVGRNKLLDATFKTGLASPAWYVGLVDAASFSAIVAGDTMASHSGWIENTAYSESTRQALTPGTIASGGVDNSAAKATFNITSSGTLKGAFVVDNSTKGGSTGTLYGAAPFSTDRSVSPGHVLRITVTLTITAT